MNFVCVLKSGGDFVPMDVSILYHQVKRCLGKDTNFVCVSDMIGFDCDVCLPLEQDYKGWWSIIEAFRVTGKCLFTGLDTVFVSDCSELWSIIDNFVSDEFMMMEPFNSLNDRMASGIMGWNGDFSWIYRTFDYEKTLETYRMEQDYTYDTLIGSYINVLACQDYFNGIVSYKHHCTRYIPSEAKIIMFHGSPRPSEVNNPVIKELRRIPA